MALQNCWNLGYISKASIEIDFKKAIQILNNNALYFAGYKMVVHEI